MPLSTYITDENVRFNGILDKAVVLDDTNDIRTLILTDGLSQFDQDNLFNFLESHLRGTPGMLSAPTAGTATLVFGTKVGTDSTGLSNATATSGKMFINFTGATIGSTPTNYRTEAGVAGYQAVDFGTAVTGSTSTGLSSGTAATAGYQAISKAGLTGSDATGLDNTSTTYTATVTVDGVDKAISIVGSAAQTYTTLVSELNADLGASATAAINGATVRITSATTGTSSTVSIAGGTLLAALTGASLTSAIPGAAATSPVYKAQVQVNGVFKPISIAGADAQTFTQLLAQLNAQIGSGATAAIVSGDLRITSAKADKTGQIVISPGTLFTAAAMPSFVAVLPRVFGSGFTRTYTSIVYVDGVAKPISFLGSEAATMADVVTQLNADLGAAATASISNNQLVITSATTGPASTVTVWDNGLLFASLAGYSNTTYAKGTTPPTYKATIVVDGVPKAISVAGTAVQTFTQLVSAITTAVGAAGTVTFTPSSSGSAATIKITSATAGDASIVSVIDDNLFANVATFNRVDTYKGISNLLAAFLKQGTPATPWSAVYHIKRVGDAPPLPANAPKASLPKRPPYVYYGGSTLDWRFMADDTAM